MAKIEQLPGRTMDGWRRRKNAPTNGAFDIGMKAWVQNQPDFKTADFKTPDFKPIQAG